LDEIAAEKTPIFSTSGGYHCSISVCTLAKLGCCAAAKIQRIWTTLRR